MAKKKKTIDVAVVLAKVNYLLALPGNEHRTPEFRRGAASVLEMVLHHTGNYQGFDFLDWAGGGFTKWVADGKPENTDPYVGDETRRMYYGTPLPEAEHARLFPFAVRT